MSKRTKKNTKYVQIDKLKLKRQENQTCRGISEDKTKCRYQVEPGKKCCTRAHADMENYTDEMFENLRECIYCPRLRWRYLIDDKYCSNCDKKYCKGKEKQSDVRCRLKCAPNSSYCPRNHSYMNGYTDEMLRNLKECSSCKRRLCSDAFDNGNSTCKECRERGAMNRAKERQIKAETRKKCEHDDCKLYAVIDKNFCGNHELDQIFLDAKDRGMKVCTNYNRNCQEKLLPLDYPFSKCKGCRGKTNDHDRSERHARIASKKCAECKVDLAHDDKGVLCKKHGAIALDYNRNRVRSDTTINSHRIHEYKRSAKKRELTFTLSDDECLKLLSEHCHYCGAYYDNINVYGEKYSMMGIDRVDNNRGYESDNVVTACKICNRLKYTHTYDNFLTYVKNIYDNYKSTKPWDSNLKITVVNYNSHCRYAKDNERPTELTKEQYDMITSDMCYYCNCTNSTNLNIDRVDSSLGYNIKNRLVSCCSICNIMKSDMNIDEFYAKIVEILVHHNKIHVDNLKKITVQKALVPTSIKRLNADILKIYEYNGKENVDRRKIHNFEQPSQYYIDKIWISFDIERFEPELEFCESKEQISHWMYYRSAISSHYPNKYSHLETLILIRDKFTKNYVGIASLTMIRPNVINNKNMDDIVRHKNIYNISTCVAIPPFSFNFCGGKLITMLMFSVEIHEYMKSKGHVIAGFLTYSLHGESIQYADIDNFNLIGYSGNTSGRDNTRVPRKVYETMIRVMKAKNYPLTSSKPNNIKTYCRYQKLPDASRHGIIRAIYFGDCSGNSHDFLVGRTDQLKPELKNVSDISKSWYVKYVLPRVKELIKRNNFMVDYDYDTYYVDESSYTRHRKKLSLKIKNMNARQKEKERQIILLCWFKTRNQKWKELTQNIKTEYTKQDIDAIADSRTIGKYILGHDYAKLNIETQKECENHINERRSLEKTNDDIEQSYNIKLNNADKFLRHRIDFVNKNTTEPIAVDIKKSRLFLTSQSYTDVRKFHRLIEFKKILKGRWMLTGSDPAEDYDRYKHIARFRYNDNIKTDYYDTIEHENDKYLFKIGLSQSDVEFFISDLNAINAPITKTNSSNVFIDLASITLGKSLKITLKYKNDTIHHMDIYVKLVENMIIEDKAQRFHQKQTYINKYLQSL